jgi:hypothetical protein
MIDSIIEIIVCGFAIVGFLVVLCLALGATLVATDGEIGDRRKEAQIATQELKAALRHARQPQQLEHILLPAMTEEDHD